MSTDISRKQVRKLLKNLSNLSPQGDEIVQAISDLKTTYKDICDSPAAYVQKIRSHLYPEYLNTDGVFEQFNGFMHLMELQHLEQHFNILTTLVESGLLTILFDFILSPAFWEAYDTRKMSYLDFADLLSNLGYLLRCEAPDLVLSGSSKVLLFVGTVIAHRAEELTTFFRTLWQRRHDFPKEADYPPSFRFRRTRNEYFGGGTCSVAITLEEFCSRNAWSLFDVLPEFGPLILYSWSQSYYPPEQSNSVLSISLRFVDEGAKGDPEMGRTGLRMLLSDLDDARDIVKICIWSLHHKTINVTLANICEMVIRLIECCPDSVYTDLQPYWIRMLRTVPRACERQLCQGDGALHEIVMPCAFTVLDCLLHPSIAVSALSDRGVEDSACVRILPLAARCGSFAVTDDGGYNYSRRICSVLNALRAEAKTYRRAQDQGAIQTLQQSANKYVPAAFADLEATSTDTSKAKERKKELSLAWRLYAAALGISTPTTSQAVEESSLPRWESCAWKRCLCHDKKAAHKLRVCTGCFQVYYCAAACQTADWTDGGHATVCRQRAAAGVDSI